jgi:CheY-like chemotaxis protein
MGKETISGRKILIVEDDFSSRLYLNKILEKAGAVIVNAPDGKEAIDIVTGDKDVEVVLMDLQLPVMDGFTAAEKIREIRKDIVIIAQTAYGLMSDKVKIINSGFDDYIIKPILYEDLLKVISTHIH